MNAISKTLAAVGAVVALAALTNPSPDRHRDTLRDTIADRSPLAGALGVGAVTAFFSSYHSLGLASYTKVGERTVTVGVFGMVFVVDSAGRQ